MNYFEFDSINYFLIGMSKNLLSHSVERTTRGYKCYEIPNPITIKIKNPTQRFITIPQRKWNYTLPFVESLWLATGRNDMELVGHYVKKMYDFADDNKFMRAGYGPRLRFFNGISNDYQTGYLQEHNADVVGKPTEVDQFEYVEASFKRDPYTRQAIIDIGDPAKDCFSSDHVLKITKDFPCTRSLQFLRNGNELDLIVHMRSNDFIWGASGVNIFNYTLIQEYFAKILGLQIGSYYHIVNNFHYYENFRDMLLQLASSSLDKDKDEAGRYEFKKSFKTVEEFDVKLKALQKYEKALRDKNTSDLVEFEDELFNDWGKVFYNFNVERRKALNFSHPLLNLIINNEELNTSISENKDQFINTFHPKNTDSEKINYWREYI